MADEAYQEWDYDEGLFIANLKRQMMKRGYNGYVTHEEIQEAFVETLPTINMVEDLDYKLEIVTEFVERVWLIITEDSSGKLREEWEERGVKGLDGDPHPDLPTVS